MGVPKFYRWISERYPCLSEVVTEFQIPDFDNLYLDMNGIIHPCSHPNDDDPHFRITEEQIFSNVCHYIEFLFKMIKPKKVFFMAVDGVAPRAKMNQQRGRRFRTAKTAVMLEEQALACGEALPNESRFDSNCITPGTPFMARLHACLKEFVIYKISTDTLWQNVRVFLSGHETPGEGEHKIMDFIRFEKSQPGYNPNTRHCLYGLDADLIMLGICSHEPHFCLLREEVKFGGKKNQKRIATPEETTFHLLHISLLRDYLYHEFAHVKDKLSFPYDVEQVVDDFVLMSFLVGNDFIPHLPQLHIHHDALPVLFQNYMDVLPTLGGYINEGGYLNLERFQMYLTKLAEYDFQKFGELSDDFQYLEGKSKSLKEENANEKTNTSDLLSVLGFSNLAIAKTAEYDSSSEDENSEEETSTLELEFSMHKTDYYMNKLEFLEVTPDVLKDQAEGYVRAIQWNLHYYYNGVVSWSWYYPHHYSPFVSDVKDFKDMEINFELGKPFLPFQQLLAVLPKLSKDLLPESYQKLMCDKDSPLVDYYPDDFMTDLNGKQQEWEAIVLIPFINENLLLKCAAIADEDLTEDEKQRNRHGPHLLYIYNSNLSNGPLSFLPNHYCHIVDTHAELTEIEQDFFRLSPQLIVKGLCEGVVLDSFILGFPTLKTLKHCACLKNEKVKVFHMMSMKDNMMLTIEEPVEKDMKALSEQLLGKAVYVGWPHLREALVVAVSNGQSKYTYEKNWRSNGPLIVPKDLTKEEQKLWKRQIETVQEYSYQRWGIFTGDIDILVSAKNFSGTKYTIANNDHIYEEKQFNGSLLNYAVQTIVWKGKPFCPDLKTEKNIDDVFPIGSVVFLLCPQYYGSLGKVCNNDTNKHKGCLIIDIELTTEPDLIPVMQNQEELMEEQFMPGYVAAQQLGIESHFFSCITGTMMIQTSPKGSSSPNRINVGLNLKFNKKNEEVQGFSKKKDNHWLYSEEAVRTLNDYLAKFADFFEKLYRYMDKDVIYIEDLYPNGGGSEVISQITTWLKEQACSLAERQEIGMNRLDSGIISAIERCVQNAAKDDVYHIKKSIKSSQLYNPLLCKGIFTPEQKTAFYLFDRVINVRPSSSVPLGLKGTIIGIQKAEKDSDYMYEVLFDREFTGGIAVGSGSRKGYRTPPDAIMNLSHGVRLQKQNANSPAKVARVVMPRINRTALFDSAVKQLRPQNSSPVHILQKANSAVPLQSKPFYKADTNESFVNWNKPAQPTSPNMTFYNSGSNQFVTPNANRLSGGASGSPKVTTRQDSSNSPQSDFQSFWSNLKKRTPDIHSAMPSQNFMQPIPSKSFAEQTYGQKVSVEELFQGAQTHQDINLKQNMQMTDVLPNKSACSPHQTDAPDMLRQLCLDLYKQPPIFRFHSHGLTNLYTTTIKLPNGKVASGIPSPSKLEAAVSAAEYGLTVLKTAFLHNPPNFCADSRPHLLPTPSMPPVNFMQPPPNYPPVFPSICPQRFDGSLMRHPQPFHPSLPDSFIQSNQRLLLSSEPPLSLQQDYSAMPLTTEAKKASMPAGDIFHIPGGGTAIIRKPPIVQKGSDNAFSSMFVPAQVMKQAIKTDGTLSASEWPGLPVKTENLRVEVPLTEAKVSPDAKNKSFSDISKCISLSSMAAEINDQTSAQSANMVVLKKTKKPKRRIAANFQNP